MKKKKAHRVLRHTFIYSIFLSLPCDFGVEANLIIKVGRCVKMRTFFFYAQSPDFHKQGLCYYLKILYL